jgi:hypothetical protein
MLLLDVDLGKEAIKNGLHGVGGDEGDAGKQQAARLEEEGVNEIFYVGKQIHSS